MMAVNIDMTGYLAPALHEAVLAPVIEDRLLVAALVRVRLAGDVAGRARVEFQHILVRADGWPAGAGQHQVLDVKSSAGCAAGKLVIEIDALEAVLGRADQVHTGRRRRRQAALDVVVEREPQRPGYWPLPPHLEP